MTIVPNSLVEYRAIPSWLPAFWCQASFIQQRQERDYCYDCEREMGHVGRCDSRLAQVHRYPVQVVTGAIEEGN